MVKELRMTEDLKSTLSFLTKFVNIIDTRKAKMYIRRPKLRGMTETWLGSWFSDNFLNWAVSN